jgi:hypothetical protein
LSTLIVDFHAGCIQSLATELESSGKTVKVLSFSAHNFIFPTGAAERWRLEADLQREILEALEFDFTSIKSAATAFLRPVSKRLAASFDEAYVMFPPALALRLHQIGVARKTIMLAAHRADLWLESPKSRAEFWRTLVTSNGTVDFNVRAASRFDQYYIENVSGMGVELQELSSSRVLGLETKNSPSRNETLIFGAKLLGKKDRRHFLDSIPGEKVLAEDVLPKGYSYEELLTFPRFGYVPYSAYSIKLLELLQTKREIFIPSDLVLLRNKALDDVRLWPHYGRRAEIRKFDKHIANSLNLAQGESFLEWLQHSQWNDALQKRNSRVSIVDN